MSIVKYIERKSFLIFLSKAFLSWCPGMYRERRSHYFARLSVYSFFAVNRHFSRTRRDNGEFVRRSFSFCDRVPAPRWYSALHFVESVYDTESRKSPLVLPLFRATVIRTLSWFRDGSTALSIVGRQWSVTTLYTDDTKYHRELVSILDFFVNFIIPL